MVISCILSTFARLLILPPSSSRPAVGGMESSIFSRLPGSKLFAEISKKIPPGPTFIVWPVWTCCDGDPTQRQDNARFIVCRWYFLFSVLLIPSASMQRAPPFFNDIIGAKTIPTGHFCGLPRYTCASIVCVWSYRAFFVNFLVF